MAGVAGVAAESGFRTHFCILSTISQESCNFGLEGAETVEKRNPAGRAPELRLFTEEAPHVACLEDASPNPTVHRRAAVSIRKYGMVSTTRTSGAQRTLPRGSSAGSCRLARQRLSSATAGSGGRTRRRSCVGHLPRTRAVGEHCQIKLRRTALPRAHLPHPARTGAQLLRALLQPARRTDLARLLEAGEF